MKRIPIECNIDFKDSWWLYRKEITDYISDYKKRLEWKNARYQEYCRNYYE